MYKSFVYIFVLVTVMFLLVSKSFASDSYPVYRYWNNSDGGHFFTSDSYERSVIQDKTIAKCVPKKYEVTYQIEDYLDICDKPNFWMYEGATFSVYNDQQTETLPVYRFYSNTLNSHFYTSSEAEKDYVLKNYPTDVWQYERVNFYAYETAGEGRIPVYRFWSDLYQRHFFTASEVEKKYVMDTFTQDIWKFEKIAFYAEIFNTSSEEAFIRGFGDAVYNILDRLSDEYVSTFKAITEYGSIPGEGPVYTEETFYLYYDLALLSFDVIIEEIESVNYYNKYSEDWLNSITDIFSYIETVFEKERSTALDVFLNYEDVEKAKEAEEYNEYIQKTYSDKFFDIVNKFEKNSDLVELNLGLTQERIKEIGSEYEPKFSRVLEKFGNDILEVVDSVN